MSFLDFARAHGVIIDRLIEDGRIHRCPTVNKERKRNGAYCWDGKRGWCHAWDQDGKTHYFNDPDAKPWTDEEKRDNDRRRRQQKRANELRHQRAAKDAAALLQRATWAEAAYMQYKGFKEKLPRHTKPEWKHGYAWVVDGDSIAKLWLEGFRPVIVGDVMFIPMYSLDGHIVGAQVIWRTPNPDRPGQLIHEKKMIPGTKAKGAISRLGNPNALTTWLCEGWATALSIKMALEQMRFTDAVVCAFSDSNLVHVAPQIPGQKFVFADNDKSGAGERAAKATGLPYCMSDIQGYDANDLHMDSKNGGIFAVQRLIQGARSIG